jgi:hypothetical protein
MLVPSINESPLLRVSARHFADLLVPNMAESPHTLEGVVAQVDD